jgi:hypothetical protein
VRKKGKRGARKNGIEERGRRGRGMSVPDARVEVVWLKSRHAMGPSWPDSTSNNRPYQAVRNRTERVSIFK